MGSTLKSNEIKGNLLFDLGMERVFDSEFSLKLLTRGVDDCRLKYRGDINQQEKVHGLRILRYAQNFAHWRSFKGQDNQQTTLLNWNGKIKQKKNYMKKKHSLSGTMYCSTSRWNEGEN